jgi:hypothetical protein
MVKSERLFNLEGSYAAKLIEHYSRSNLRNYPKPFVYKLASDDRFVEERTRLERLFERYKAALENHPRREDIIKDKLGRFWEEDRQHFGAYYELETFDFLKSCQVPFSIEPDTPQGGRPDFRIDQPPILVEVATVFDIEEFEKREHTANQILQALRSIQNQNLELRIHECLPQVNSCQIEKLKKRIHDWVASNQAGSIMLKLEVEGIAITVIRHEQPVRIESKPVTPFNPDLIKKVLDRKSCKYQGPLLIALGIHQWPINIIYPEITQLVNEATKRKRKRINGLLIIEPEWRQPLVRSCQYYLFCNPSRIDPTIFAGNCQIIDVTKTPR